MTPPETGALTAELVSLRGEINGFRGDLSAVSRDLGEIKTACAVLVERSNRTEKDLSELEQRVSSLERNRWPLPSLAAVVAVGSLAWQVVGR